MKNFMRKSLIATAFIAFMSVNQWAGITFGLRSLYPNTSPLVLGRAYNRLQMDTIHGTTTFQTRTPESQVIDFENHINDIQNS